VFLLTAEENPCAEDQQVCNWVWDWTGDETTADVSDIVIGTPLALVGLLVLGMVLRWILHKVVDRLVRGAESGVLPDRVTPVASARRAQRAQTMGSLLKSVITGLLFAVIGTMMLSEIGVNIAPIIASAGILGIALGFGA
jgi:small conductance mechanosensitive channel